MGYKYHINIVHVHIYIKVYIQVFFYIYKMLQVWKLTKRWFNLSLTISKRWLNLSWSYRLCVAAYLCVKGRVFIISTLFQLLDSLCPDLHLSFCLLSCLRFFISKLTLITKEQLLSSLFLHVAAIHWKNKTLTSLKLIGFPVFPWARFHLWYFLSFSKSRFAGRILTVVLQKGCGFSYFKDQGVIDFNLIKSSISLY